MSVLTSIEAPVAAEPVDVPAPLPDFRTAQPRLRLVTESGPAGTSRPAATAADRLQPGSSSISGAAGRPLAVPVLTPSAVLPPRPRSGVERQPVRLTRRGRALLVLIGVAVIAVAALLVSLAGAGGAQAANHGQPGGGYQGMHEIVVRPGQTLWSIASAAEPGADPRLVVQQIMSANAMTGTDIAVGQLLWVPR
jgi:LysM domain